MVPMVTREPCTHILNLPAEILLEIAKNIDIVHDRLHLIKTCTKFKTLLLEKWTPLSQSMNHYPYSYIALCADRLRTVLGHADSKLSRFFGSNIGSSDDLPELIKFCKRYAPITISDLHALGKIQTDVLDPVVDILLQHDLSNPYGTIPPNYRQEFKERYERGLYVYLAYCHLFRASIDAGTVGSSGSRDLSPNLFSVSTRISFLGSLICGPPEQGETTCHLQLDSLLSNAKFEIPMPAKCPIAWQTKNLSKITTRILLHGGLHTLKIIASQTALVDEDGNFNGNLPSEVLSHVADVVAKISAAEWASPPTDLLRSQRFALPPSYWFSLKSDLEELLHPPAPWQLNYEEPGAYVIEDDEHYEYDSPDDDGNWSGDDGSEGDE